jgi:Fe-S cluster assembly scaffold protein SufB
LTAPAARPRPARRALDDLSLRVDEEALEALASTSPDWLATDRRDAYARWTSLPAESNLLYTPYIDLRGAALEGSRLVGPSDADRSIRPTPTLPDDADALIEVVEGALAGVALSGAAIESGVRLRELRHDLEDARDALTREHGLSTTDKFAQLTRAFWSQGVVLDVPADVRLSKPIVIRWALGVPDRALVTRTVVRLGDGAAASVVEELVPSSDQDDDERGQAFFAGTMEVTLGAKAALQVASLQELPANVVAVQHRTATVGEGGTLQWALAQLGGRLVRSRVDNRLVGDHSSVRQVEIVFGAGVQLFDLTSYTTHIGKNTTGDLLSKAALLEKARTYMKGLITIERSANGTDSFLGEFGMNLSKDARSVAIPSLEIDQPDCRRAAHSSSVGPVDETQLFYLESRGIPPDEARKFIVLGFLEPVVARVPLASAQDRLRELLEGKWIAGSGEARRAAA